MSNSDRLEYIRAIDLSGTPRRITEQAPEADAGEVFDQAKNQAQIVGSGIFSFAKGVDSSVREAISDSSMLAQLVANKKVNAGKKPLEWFSEYTTVLQNVGWVLQDSQWTDYSTSGTAAKVGAKVIEIVTAALSPAAGALSIIKSVIDVLTAMQPGSSWLTLFSRESQFARVAKFQIGLVENGPEDDVFVSLVACVVEAKSDITQVLVFKFRQANATFKANSNKVSINRTSLAELGPAIRMKIRAYQADYLSSIADI